MTPARFFVAVFGGQRSAVKPRSETNCARISRRPLMAGLATHRRDDAEPRSPAQVGCAARCQVGCHAICGDGQVWLTRPWLAWPALSWTPANLCVWTRFGPSATAPRFPPRPREGRLETVTSNGWQVENQTCYFAGFVRQGRHCYHEPLTRFGSANDPRPSVSWGHNHQLMPL